MNDVWQLQGTTEQQVIIADALARCNFPFPRLLPELQRSINRSTIPVEWIDLSRYSHYADSSIDDSVAHVRHHEEPEFDGDEYDVLAYRQRVLGLAWYSGKVSIEATLVNQPTLAQEVFLSEGAHMIDFFYLTETQRQRIFALYHDWDPYDEGSWEDHTEHGWFDIGTYREFVGESFMGGFTNAFSDVPVSIPFSHVLQDQVSLRLLRKIVLDQAWLFGVERSKVYHDSHRGISHDLEWPVDQSPADRRPCQVCKP